MIMIQRMILLIINIMKNINRCFILGSYTYDLRYIEYICTENILTNVLTPASNLWVIKNRLFYPFW